LRLADILKSQGKHKEADERRRDSLVYNPRNIDAWSVIGREQFESNQLRLSRKTFEKILTEFDKRELYALCSLGNIHLITARETKNPEEVREFFFFSSLFSFFFIF